MATQPDRNLTKSQVAIRQFLEYSSFIRDKKNRIILLFIFHLKKLVLKMTGNFQSWLVYKEKNKVQLGNQKLNCTKKS